jgi:hypothetical protein
MNFIDNFDFEKEGAETGDKKMKKVHSYEATDTNA